jgi:hypothetical protein
MPDEDLIKRLEARLPDQFARDLQTRLEDNFPFTCTTAASTTAPFKLLSDQTEMEVDTSSWRGEGEESEQGSH